ncbi:MlaD family protein [Crocinitomicaceae bacterium]|mgnify:FL=1|nr:MlaD family protein [Crocinitomicaceae bacterium]
MKISKEIKTGVIAIAAIGLLVTGVNFLKGNSFFGGDEIYYSYYPNSGQLAGASNVTLNGVAVGKVLSIENVASIDPNKVVKVSFNIQHDNIKIPKGTIVQIDNLDLFGKGLVLKMPDSLTNGYYKPGATIPGELVVDMMSQVKQMAEPVAAKLQTLMTSIEKVVQSASTLVDTNSAETIEGTILELKVAIKRLGNVAKETESLVNSEKVKLGRIFSNVEGITENLKASNEKVAKIIGNTKKITDDLVSADFKSVINAAKSTLSGFNKLLASANSGEGTLGKLISDEKLYDELVQTNKSLQNLVNDISIHPERYIHFSAIGRKTKGVPLTSDEEKRLRKLLDSTAN